MPPVAIIHLDESCLGNGKEQATPGGAGGLIEIRHNGGIERRDFWLSDPDTTNNRMALEGAISFMKTLASKEVRCTFLAISDSQYLVKGIREWLPGWVGKGWQRKGGAIENLALWQELHATLRRHHAHWAWVRGHVGHAKNEYANDLAVAAAKSQTQSSGAEPSGFLKWLEVERGRKRYLGYDPDAAFAKLESLLLSERPIPLALSE